MNPKFAALILSLARFFFLHQWVRLTCHGGVQSLRNDGEYKKGGFSVRAELARHGTCGVAIRGRGVSAVLFIRPCKYMNYE